MKKIPVTLFVVSALLFILPEKTEAQGPGNTKEQPANLKVRNYSKRQEV